MYTYSQGDSRIIRYIPNENILSEILNKYSQIPYTRAYVCCINQTWAALCLKNK